MCGSDGRFCYVRCTCEGTLLYRIDLGTVFLSFAQALRLLNRRYSIVVAPAIFLNISCLRALPFLRPFSFPSFGGLETLVFLASCVKKCGGYGRRFFWQCLVCVCRTILSTTVPVSLFCLRLGRQICCRILASDAENIYTASCICCVPFSVRSFSHLGMQRKSSPNLHHREVFRGTTEWTE